MKYIINIEPKINKTKQEQSEYCNIISTKDSIITRIITHKGVELVDTNDHVSKDQILITGDIKYNEELKKEQIDKYRNLDLYNYNRSTIKHICNSIIGCNYYLKTSNTTSILSSTSSVIFKPASFNSLISDFVP